jgi:prepilin-type N-terminal cleavage/methylation domain-containing protein
MCLDSRNGGPPRGFTSIELAVSLAIVLIIGAIAYTSLSRVRPRASLTGTAAEVAGLLYNARQNALATGRHTVVVFLPQQPNSDGGIGRVMAYEDASYRFFSATPSPGAASFSTFDGSKAGYVESMNLIGDVDLPRGVTFGLGGATAPTLPAPYDSVAVSACNFCSTSGDGRGAIVFDSRGSARFFSAVGTPVSLLAGTIGLNGSPTIPGYHLLFITPTTGAVRPYVGG